MPACQLAASPADSQTLQPSRPQPALLPRPPPPPPPPPPHTHKNHTHTRTPSLPHMKSVMTRWKVEPLKCRGLPERPVPFSPVHRQRKFSAVLGTTSARSSITMRPSGVEPAGRQAGRQAGGGRSRQGQGGGGGEAPHRAALLLAPQGSCCCRWCLPSLRQLTPWLCRLAAPALGGRARPTARPARPAHTAQHPTGTHPQTPAGRAGQWIVSHWGQSQRPPVLDQRLRAIRQRRFSPRSPDPAHRRGHSHRRTPAGRGGAGGRGQYTRSERGQRQRHEGDAERAGAHPGVGHG